MRYRKVLAHFGVMAGLALGAAGTLSARDWDDSWHGRRAELSTLAVTAR